MQLCLQTGKGYLQPNDPFNTSSVVTYGLSAAILNMTATGTAQVELQPSLADGDGSWMALSLSLDISIVLQALHLRGASLEKMT